MSSTTMTMTAVPVLPESAPFTAAQRAWLNGFFAGVFGAQVATQAGASADAAGAVPPAAVIEAEEEMPWHDPGLSIEDRLKLAEGKPKPRKLMAAMAQLDCGACGYQCQTYAEAIASGAEKDLTRCAPGGKETMKKLKVLVLESSPATSAQPTPVQPKKTAPAQPAGYDRNNPFPARLLHSKALNKTGSTKDTRMIAFDLKGSGLSYNVGDALGVYPENCSESVNWLLDRLNASGAEEITLPDGSKTTLFEALLKHKEITTPTDEMIEVLAKHSAGHLHAEALRAMLDENGDGIPAGHEIIDLLAMFPTSIPPIAEFVAALKSLQPRLYSIASSLKAHPDEVHLTVGVVRYVNGRQRQCKGVTSTYLSDRLRQGQKARVFVQTSHGFRLPFDQSVPIIMVGPGTGIAPFRAFLQERKASNAAGKSWLFFGDQRSEFDYLYREELNSYLQDGTLKYLDTAFSRDQSEKIYVQTRMLARGGEIWNWIQQGAHFYVCGDAKRMAADVDAALRQIVAKEGGMSDEHAKEFLANMSKNKRYQRDVY